MVLELHIFGPAFGVPSIDADCLAAVIYFQQCLPAGTWKLVACSSLDQNPFQRLPAIRDESIWIAGFQQIIQYLRDHSAGDWDLDANLDELQRADNDAYHSFIYARGLPLLDLSLYVSSDNYTNCTRSAWADLLSWPESWTLPHQIRDRAKRRSEHLGLNALDVDAAQENEKQNEGLAAHIPKSLRKPKQTVTSLLGRTAHNTRFRLDAVTADFLEPLQEKLGDNDWLMGDSMSSADCLALAYLTLMQTPELPQSWLRDALTKKHARLGQWAAGHAFHALGIGGSEGLAAKDDTKISGLPWTTQPTRSWSETATTIIEEVVGSVPFLRLAYTRREVSTRVSAGNDQYQKRNVMYRRMRNQQIMYSQIVTVCIGGAAASAWLLHLGIFSLPQRRSPPTRRSFGEAGMLLGLR